MMRISILLVVIAFAGVSALQARQRLAERLSVQSDDSDSEPLALSGEDSEENALFETQSSDIHPYKHVEDYKQDMQLRGLLFALELGALGKGTRELAAMSRANPDFKAKLTSMHLRAKAALSAASALQSGDDEKSRMLLAETAIAVGVEAAEAGKISNDPTIAARLKKASKYISQCLIELHDAGNKSREAAPEQQQMQQEGGKNKKALVEAGSKSKKSFWGRIRDAKWKMLKMQGKLVDQPPSFMFPPVTGAWNREDQVVIGGGAVSYGGDALMAKEFMPKTGLAALAARVPRDKPVPVYFPIATTRKKQSDKSLLVDQSGRIADCVGCVYIVGVIEGMVGAAKNQDLVYQSFKKTCSEVEQAQIFFMACSQMNEKLDDFIVDYRAGLTASESCEKNRICRLP